MVTGPALNVLVGRIRRKGERRKMGGGREQGLDRSTMCPCRPLHTSCTCSSTFNADSRPWNFPGNHLACLVECGCFLRRAMHVMSAEGRPDVDSNHQPK